MSLVHLVQAVLKVVLIGVATVIKDIASESQCFHQWSLILGCWGKNMSHIGNSFTRETMIGSVGSGAYGARATCCR
jgi:hypothetical protein